MEAIGANGRPDERPPPTMVSLRDQYGGALLSVGMSDREANVIVRDPPGRPTGRVWLHVAVKPAELQAFALAILARYPVRTA